MIGEHDQDHSPFYIDFTWGVPVTALKPFIIRFDVPLERLAKLDVLMADMSPPIVRDRVLDLIRQFDPEGVSSMEVKATASDGPIEGLHALNITRNVKAINWEKSNTSPIYARDGSLLTHSIAHLVCHPDALEKHGIDIARDTEFLGHILVSQRLRNAFVKAKIKGVDLREPERLFG